MVEAFFAAARRGDFDALVGVLDPEVVLRFDGGKSRPGAVLRGATTVASSALTFAEPARVVRAAVVNGAAGVVVTVDRQPVSVMGFTVRRGRIVAIDALADPDRLSRLGLAGLRD